VTAGIRPASGTLLVLKFGADTHRMLTYTKAANEIEYMVDHYGCSPPVGCQPAEYGTLWGTKETTFKLCGPNGNSHTQKGTVRKKLELWIICEYADIIDISTRHSLLNPNRGKRLGDWKAADVEDWLRDEMAAPVEVAAAAVRSHFQLTTHTCTCLYCCRQITIASTRGRSAQYDCARKLKTCVHLILHEM
jgi:hypothetical protein